MPRQVCHEASPGRRAAPPTISIRQGFSSSKFSLLSPKAFHIGAGSFFFLCSILSYPSVLLFPSFLPYAFFLFRWRSFPSAGVLSFPSSEAGPETQARSPLCRADLFRFGDVLAALGRGVELPQLAKVRAHPSFALLLISSTSFHQSNGRRKKK